MRNRKARHPRAAAAGRPLMDGQSEAYPRERVQPPIVGVAASAEAGAASAEFLKQIPANCGMAIVVVQEPGETSLTPALVRSARAAVTEVNGPTPVEANQVYIVPPETPVLIRNGALCYAGRREKNAADAFFRSLAEDAGKRAVGVALAPGSSCELGLGEIQERGGIAFPSVAPGAAARVAEEISRIAHHPYLARDDVPPAPRALLGRIFALLGSAGRADFTRYKAAVLASRIWRRMALRALEDPEEYAALLERDGAEAERLYQDIIVHRTGFFHDAAAFAALRREVFPLLAERHSAAAPIRVWVPGCSTGEEVYSFAISLLEVLDERGLHLPVHLIGTDLDHGALATARAGVYPEDIALDVSPARLEQFFEKAENGYRVADRLARTCLFAVHDVAHAPLFSGLDLIACRDVLAGLRARPKKRILNLLHGALAPGGFLFTRPGQAAAGAGLFEEVDRTAGIYARRRSGALHNGRQLEIGKLRRALEEAGAAGDLARAIVDTVREPLIVLEQDFRVNSANAAFYQTFNLAREQVEGRSLLDLGDGEWDTHAIRGLLEDVRAAESGRVQGVEVEHGAGRAGQRVFRLSARNFERYAGGARMILVSMEDITALRRTAESRYRRLFESSQDGIVIADAATRRITDANPALAALLGVPPAALVGRKLEDTCMFEQSEAGQLLLRDLRAGETAHYEDCAIVTCRGEHMRVEMLGSSYTEDRRKLLQINIRDVTERRRAHEALRRSEEQLGQSQKMQAIGRIAGGVAHDFNNMLTAILGYCELALGSPAPETLLRSIEQIQKAAERASNLTRQLLAFGRRQTVQPRPMDLNQAITAMNEMLRQLLRENIEFEMRLDPAAGVILADPGQIEQMLVNLVINARDAMPQGGRLEVSTLPVELTETLGLGLIPVPPGRYVLLEVRDNGVGISPEVMSRIFEPFFTTKPKGMGTGLGLATLYNIVRQAGGTVAVESEPGQGTVFRIFLPRAEGEVAPMPAEERRGDTSARGETILLAEDEPAVRSLVRQVLEGAGYRVLEAASGEDALQIAEEHGGGIELLLTDVVMPNMNGRELAQALRTRREETRVLYMSGHTEDMVVKKEVVETGSNFLSKPFGPDELLRKVREALG